MKPILCSLYLLLFSFPLIQPALAIYDPSVGRWLSRDPLENVEMIVGPNLYAYVDNNPINLLDLLGLRPGTNTFWPAYPNYGTSASDVWNSIGGWLNKTYGPNSNSCAARVSKGLNGGGDPIQPTRGVQINKNDDGNRYVISARELRSYLNKNWGAPDRTVNDEADLQNLIKSLKPDESAVVCSDAHAGVVKPGYKDPYIPYGSGDAWILPAAK